MFATLLPGLILFSALGCGLIAGIFLAFSSFVMAALDRLPAEQGAAAMQSINITVLNPLFLGLFFGTGLLCLILALIGAMHWSMPAGLCLVIAALLYLVGTLGVTMIRNVPLNEALAKIKVTSPEGAALWQRYCADWTRWNHVRTICAGLGSALLIASLMI